MLLNKNLTIIFLIVVSLSLGVTALYAASLTDPDNQHNLSSSATHGGPQAQVPASGGTDEICIFCHTPHSAVPDTPLWSRPDPATATFPLYANDLVIKGAAGSPVGTPAGAEDRSQYKNDGSVVYPSGSSRLCLSCHDGVTSIGTLSDGSSIAMVGNVDLISGTAVIDLSTSHPISFVYDNDVLVDVLTVYPGAYQLPPDGDGIDTPLDGENKMQCTTCHDPHDDTSLDGGGLPPFWRHTTNVVADEYDDVCNQCHIAPAFDPNDTAGNNHTLP